CFAAPQANWGAVSAGPPAAAHEQAAARAWPVAAVLRCRTKATGAGSRRHLPAAQTRSALSIRGANDWTTGNLAINRQTWCPPRSGRHYVLGHQRVGPQTHSRGNDGKKKGRVLHAACGNFFTHPGVAYLF